MKIVLIILIAVIVLNILFIVIQNNRVPSLGHNQGMFQPLSSKPNAVSTQAEDTEKWVMPWPYKIDRATTLQAIETAVAEYGGAELKQSDEQYRYYVFTTPTLHFHDDVEFYLNDEEQAVHFRSASRAGYSDMGLNRKRYEQLKELYDQATVEQ